MSKWYCIASDNDLIHYGVLGMKWGVRRYQNKDGSLTSAGKRKYYKDYVKRVKNQEDSYNYIKQTISKKDVEKLAIYHQELQNSFKDYKSNIKKYFPEASELNPIDREELIDAVMITDKKYSNQYNKITRDAHNKAIEYSREFFTKEQNQKMTDNDIELTKQYDKIFYSLLYDDNKDLENLKKQVKSDPRIKALDIYSKNQKEILDKISKEEEKIVNDLVGEMSYLPGDETWRNRFNIGFNASNYTRELLEDKSYQEYINSRIKNIIDKGA